MSAVLIVGNPVDGLTFTGPFATTEDGVEYAQSSADIEGDWWVVDLILPLAFPNMLPLAVFKGPLPGHEGDDLMVTLWPDGGADSAWRHQPGTWSPPRPMEEQS